MLCGIVRGAGLLPAASAFEEMKLASMEAGEEGCTVRLPHLPVTVREALLVCRQALCLLPLVHLAGGLMGVHMTEGKWFERLKMLLPCP